MNIDGRGDDVGPTNTFLHDDSPVGLARAELRAGAISELTDTIDGRPSRRDVGQGVSRT